MGFLRSFLRQLVRRPPAPCEKHYIRVDDGPQLGPFDSQREAYREGMAVLRAKRIASETGQV